MGQQAGARTDRKKVEIEKLLQWAWLDELPKRLLNATGESGERFWRRLEQYGSLGGIDIDEPAAGVQRYGYVGEPHPDAMAIERAVAALGAVTVDWASDFAAIAGELAFLVEINGVGGRSRFRTGSADSGYPRDGLARHTAVEPFGYIREHHGGRLRRGVRSRRIAAAAPRDVLHVASINLPALVQMHAIKRSRPHWWHEPPLPLPVHAERGGGVMVVGTNWGHGRYSEGAYCPLRWSPSPIQIVLDRADYLLWHRALTTLAKTLALADHQALAPQAAALPWREGEIAPRALKQTTGRKGFFLPFPPEAERSRAGPAVKKPRCSEVRHPPLD